ncbi:hypothetical protein SCA6_013842 [Theobroma cacao]
MTKHSEPHSNHSKQLTIRLHEERPPSFHRLQCENGALLLGELHYTAPLERAGGYQAYLLSSVGTESKNQNASKGTKQSRLTNVQMPSTTRLAELDWTKPPNFDRYEWDCGSKQRWLLGRLR